MRSHAVVVNVSDTPSVNKVTLVAGAVSASSGDGERVTHLQPDQFIDHNRGLLRHQVHGERFRPRRQFPIDLHQPRRNVRGFAFEFTCSTCSA